MRPDDIAAGIREWHPGRQLAVAVAVGYVVFLVASAALAGPAGGAVATPASSTDAPDEATIDRTTIVGLQGPFTGRQGYARLVAGDGTTLWQGRESWANFDVTPLPGDRVMTAFIEKGRVDCGPYASPCPHGGFRVYDTANRTLLREWTFPVPQTHNSEPHDVERLPSGEVLVADMVAERVFAVDRSGAITWQWNASDFYEPPTDPTSRDWLHINDVDRIGEERYLVSVRNANQLLVIERGAGVVDVINADRGGPEESCLLGGRGLVPGADGDVRCGNPDVMQEQHNPQWLGNGRVMVADSKNDRVTILAEQDGRWRPVVNYTSAGGVAFSWPRDADRLANGNLLVTDTYNSRVVELTPNGTLVWQYRTGQTSIPYEADRLPDGEAVTLNRTASVETPAVVTGQTERVEIPGVSLLFTTLVGVAPVPYWATQWHLLGLLVALAVALGGLVWARRAG